MAEKKIPVIEGPNHKGPKMGKTVRPKPASRNTVPWVKKIRPLSGIVKKMVIWLNG
jgi:hypothetical protein